MKRLIVLLFVVALIASGCIWRVAIDEGELGLLMNDGVKVDKILLPGRYGPYSDWYVKVQQVNVSALTVTWSDPDDLATIDKQPIGASISVTFRRGPSECIVEMRRKYRTETEDDEALKALVLDRVPSNARASTAGYTFDGMLTKREEITNSIHERLQANLRDGDLCVEIVNVNVNNLSPSDAYRQILERKSNAKAEVEAVQEETRLADQRLLLEQGQTEVELELARRENLINQELAKTFAESPEYYELERLKLLADVVSKNDKIYFVPQGTDLTLFLGGQSIIPGGNNE